MVGLVLPILGGVDTSHAIFIAALAALASFLTADLVVYPRYGNMLSIVVDVLISAVVLVELTLLFNFKVPVYAYITSLALLAGGEWYFHSYLGRVLFPGRRR
ncbi:MAG: YndM family protein [Actinobacteria bacterium]|nr:YndM family protein [Actinomycetota bacterium]